MNRRALVMVLAAVVAVAVAIPALADSGTTAKTASVRGLSKRALAKAKVSLRLSHGAKRLAKKAASSAAAAQVAATTAKTEASQAFSKAASAREAAGGANFLAEQAKAEIASIRPKIGLAEGKESTESGSFVKLDGGPSVTVTVPTSNLVQVWAQALIEGEGAVSLYEDNHQVEGQAIDCNGAKGVLFAAEEQGGEPVLAATPAAYDFTGACATLGAPGPVLFQATTGEHTFELRYALCACEPGGGATATFSQRRLVVAALP